MTTRREPVRLRRSTLPVVAAAAAALGLLSACGAAEPEARAGAATMAADDAAQDASTPTDAATDDTDDTEDTASVSADIADLVGTWTYADDPGVEIAIEEDRSIHWYSPPAADDPDQWELTCVGRVSETGDSEMPFEIFLACTKTAGTSELEGTLMWEAVLTGPDELTLVGDREEDSAVLARTD